MFFALKSFFDNLDCKVLENQQRMIYEEKSCVEHQIVDLAPHLKDVEEIKYDE